jgi:ferritin-like metal-binding protein YciE
MNRNFESFQDLFEFELQDLYSAEEQIINALPQVIEKIEHEELKDAVQEHLEVSRKQKDRLDEIFSMLDVSPGEIESTAVKGMISDMKNLLEMGMNRDVLDAGIIAALQRVEHYEIAVYGTARHFAERLEKQEIVDLLEQSLNEEKDADHTLNEIAINTVNVDAMSR